MLKLPFNSPNYTEINKKEETNLLNFLFFCVGVPGFEPGTPCSQSRCANRAALHPVSNPGFAFRGDFPPIEEIGAISDCKYKSFFVFHKLFRLKSSKKIFLRLICTPNLTLSMAISSYRIPDFFVGKSLDRSIREGPL